MTLLSYRYGSFFVEALAGQWINLTKELVISALQKVIWRQPPKKGLIHHSDCGLQYYSKAYRVLLDKYESDFNKS
ncbi:MAG: hypothetical protein ACLRY5_05800 [Zhenhengia sp.]